MTIKIAPSLLSADFGRLAEEVRAAEAAGGDVVHVDVMDGRFVPNITIGPLVVSAIARAARVPLQVHLMIVEPDKYIEDFAKAGAETIFVHEEACVHLHRCLQQIRGLGKRAGVALNPHTPIESIRHVLGELDAVLLMTVNPGFGAQAFLPFVVPKIAELRAEIERQRVNVEIAVDGGIAPETAGLVAAAGATNLVAGAAIFKQPDYGAAVRAIRAAAEAGAP